MLRRRWLASLLARPRQLLAEAVDDARQDAAGASDGLAYLTHLLRGNRAARPETPAAAPAPPVLLIHGFFGTRGSMLPLARRLAADGRRVFAFDLGPFNVRDIRRSAFLIHRRVEDILEETGDQVIDIVAHSMGGLIGLYYIKKLGGAPKVRKLIMLGTPINGTWSALSGVATLGVFSRSSWQILPGSRLLAELAAAPPQPGVELYAISAARDWICPPSSCRFPEAVQISVPLGHSSLVVSPEVYRHVIWALRRDASQP